MDRARVVGICGLAAVALAGRALEAQRLTVSAARAVTDQPLLGDLAGAALHYRLGSGARRVAGRVGLTWLAATHRRVGVPCSGLVDAATCPPEPLRDRVHLLGPSAGVTVGLVRGTRGWVDATGDAWVADAQTRTRGRTSGRGLSAGKLVGGGDVGLDAALVPRRGGALAVVVGVAAGRAGAVAANRVDDGYTPLDGGFSLTRAHAGLAWTWASSR